MGFSVKKTPAIIRKTSQQIEQNYMLVRISKQEHSPGQSRRG
jgi:hypothetical protein